MYFIQETTIKYFKILREKLLETNYVRKISLVDLNFMKDKNTATVIALGKIIVTTNLCCQTQEISRPVWT
jgi:hypothetical protein